MKEYLDPSDWSMKFVRPTDGAISADWIEIPEGAEELSVGGCFYKDNRSYWYNTNKQSWFEKPWSVLPAIVWRRPTLPEELPFIDDEPPAYYHNAIRPKPRLRLMATLGGEV